MKRKSELQWLRRWRRRWGVTWGSFQSRDTVTVECGQKKACCSRLRGPQFGARELPQGRTWAVRGLQKRGRIAAPKSGPQRQLIRPGGPPKRTLFLRKHWRFCFLVNTNFGFVFWGRCVWPGHCRVALEQLLAQPGAAGPETAASQHGRDGDSIGSNGAARDDMFCGSALADDAAIYSSTSDTRAVAHDVLPNGLCV